MDWEEIQMVMTNFLQERKSVREYKDQDLSAKDLERVQNIVDRGNTNCKAAGISFNFFQNGQVVYDRLQGKAGYSGVMIKASHYVSMTIAGREDKDQLKTGYTLEQINTDLVDLGLGTCWITLDHVDPQVKQEAFGTDGKEIDYIIALGYPRKKKLFEPEKHSARMEVREFVFENDFDTPASPDTLDQLGLFDVFSSVRYAPSHKNAQPWRFVLEGSQVKLYMVTGKEDNRSLVDCGLMMFYFQEMMKTLGTQKEWVIEDSFSMEGNYLYLGSYSL